jgi:cell division septal protein FtsQ
MPKAAPKKGSKRPPASRTKRRSSRPIPWRGILWLLTVVNIIVGVWWSPVTAVRHVRVTGVPSFDQPRVARLLEKLNAVPCIRVNPRNTESLVLELPESKAADLTRNPFGSARLDVSYRQPIARKFNDDHLGLSADGVFYVADAIPADLPTIKLPVDEPEFSMGFGNSMLGSRLAELCIKAREMRPAANLRIDLSADGTVCLNIDTGQVRLGSTDDLDRKMQVLTDRLEKNPLELSQFLYLDLTSPEDPAGMLSSGQKKL